tara:strand:+ start:698 stop:949 length:252 start_codon:yes stop_codon:yes gene_type:complete
MKLFLSLTVFAVFLSGCTKNTSQVSDLRPNVISETQRQRDLCLDWYAYRIETAKAISDLNLKTEKDSDLIVYCEFFKNVADTN